ncbi:uncharacterized protein si:ch211-244b2.3 isoform X2 [Melanotaenia boesemani]|nr:uncharacterized protein si:ch211-244b2.3 isoform X2 [Melanotaenia boesemani]
MWLRIDNDHVIETHYCQPGAKGITINTSQGQVFIDFNKLQTLTAALKVQRLSFLPQGQTEEMGWYFRDDQLWCEYGSQSSSLVASSVSSKDIEQHFSMNPHGSLRFTVGLTSYLLDFSTMTQTNVITGLCRNIRRRPKLSSIGKGFHPTPVLPTVSPFQLPKECYKWEFMGDEGQWIEYQAHICSFDSAAIEKQYQQNHQGQLHFWINTFSYILDFSKMCQTNMKIGTTRSVRRIKQSSSSAASPRWQFLDVDGMWKDYSKGRHQCSISSQDIEHQFQLNPSGVMKFNTMKFCYELNFSAMTQRNLSTNTTRSVRRRQQ